LSVYCIYYQKIDKYKRKYRENISVGKFPRDFTDGISEGFYRRKYSLGIYWGNYRGKFFFLKNDDVSFLPTKFIPSVKSVGKLWTLFIMSIIKGITDGSFCWYFPESSRTVHLPIALLIVVLYGQNHRRIEKSSVSFGGFLKKFN